MNKIKTVRQFLIDYNQLGKLDFQGDEYSKTLNDVEVLDSMIEFAKMHVKSALESASNVRIDEDLDYESGNKFYYQNEEGILNAYPLENIK